MKKNLDPKCRLCWDKGFSTEYKGASYAMPDFHGQKEHKVADEGVVKNYCSCEKGREMNPNKVVNSEYLTDEEYDRMKQDVESRENHIADANKKVSPLDEYLVTCKEVFFWECDGDEIEQRERLWPVVEHMIRLAVQNHADRKD
jgi:hypothetical protein